MALLFKFLLACLPLFSVLGGVGDELSALLRSMPAVRRLSMTSERAPSSRRIVSVLPTMAARTRSSGRWV